MKKKKNRIYYIVLSLSLIYASWILVNQYIEIKDLQAQGQILDEKMKNLKMEVKKLEDDKKYGKDIKYIEKTARERLKMVKPNEIIYVDVNQPKTNQIKGN